MAMNKLTELSYIYLVNQLKEENQMLKDEIVALRKLYINKSKRQ